MTTDTVAAQESKECALLPSDLALLGWTQHGTQLFAPGGGLSICMNSFPPPACFNVARDQPWHAAEIRARIEDAKKPKPKKVKRIVKQAEPTQEEMSLC